MPLLGGQPGVLGQQQGVRADPVDQGEGLRRGDRVSRHLAQQLHGARAVQLLDVEVDREVLATSAGQHLVEVRAALAVPDRQEDAELTGPVDLGEIGQCAHRCGVQPLGVVNHDQQRLIGCRISQQVSEALVHKEAHRVGVHPLGRQEDLVGISSSSETRARNGHHAGVPASSGQLVQMARAPCPGVRAAASAANRVLPMPARPVTSTHRYCPFATSASARSRTASSSSRPTIAATARGAPPPARPAPRPARGPPVGWREASTLATHRRPASSASGPHQGVRRKGRVPTASSTGLDRLPGTVRPGGDRLVVPQDRGLQLAYVGAGLQSELLVQRAGELREGIQGLRRSASSVQGDHAQPPAVLAQRVGLDHGLRAGDRLGHLVQPQQSGHPSLDALGVQLVQLDRLPPAPTARRRSRPGRGPATGGSRSWPPSRRRPTGGSGRVQRRTPSGDGTRRRRAAPR